MKFITWIILKSDAVVEKIGDLEIYYQKIYDAINHPKIWVIVSSLSLFVSQYIFSEWHFAIGIFILIFLDTISGMYVAQRTHVFDGKKFRDMLKDKILAYTIIIVAFSVSTKVLLEDSDINLIRYLNLPFYSLFIAVELRSIVWKWYEFKRWEFLGKILELLDKHRKDKLDAAN